MRDARTVLSGKSYTGKTARMFHWFEENDCRRVLLVDAKCAQLVGLEGWRHVWLTYDPYGKGLIAPTIEPLLRVLTRNKFRVLAHVRTFHREVLECLCVLAMAAKNLVLAVDELSLFIPPGPFSSLPAATTAVIVSGTHEGVAFIGTTQRLSGVHITARSVVQRQLIFRTDERADVALLGNYLPADLVSKVSSLPDHAYIDWTDYRPPFVDFSLRGKLGRYLPKERLLGSGL